MAFSEPCLNPTEWTFKNYGTRACGGPLGHIAYSSNIDTELFLKKVEAHRAAQQAYNEKWGVLSNYSIPTPPIGVIWQDDEPILDY